MSELPTSMHTYYLGVPGTEGRVPLHLGDQIGFASKTEFMRSIFTDEELSLGRNPEAADIYLSGVSLKLGCPTEAVNDSVPVSKLMPKNPDDVYSFVVPPKKIGDADNQVRITRKESGGEVYNGKRTYSVYNLLIAAGCPIATDLRVKKPSTEVVSISEVGPGEAEEGFDRIVLLPYPSFHNLGSGPLKKIRYIPFPESMLLELRSNLLRWITEDPTKKPPTSVTGAVESDKTPYTPDPETSLSGGDAFFEGVREKVIFFGGGGMLVRSEDILGENPNIVTQNEDGTLTLNIPVYNETYNWSKPGEATPTGLTVTPDQFNKLTNIALRNRRQN